MVHGDGRRRSRVQGPGGTTLGDGNEPGATRHRIGGQAEPLRTEDSADVTRQSCCFQGHRAGQIVHPNRLDSPLL